MSVENVAAPPPPPPLARSVSSKKKLYQALTEGRAPVEGDHEEARIILGQRESRWVQTTIVYSEYFFVQPLSV